MRRIIGAALQLLAAACTMAAEGEPPAGSPGEPAGGENCNADGLEDLVGRPATSELAADALRRSRSRTMRWIRPGDVVTMDYSPQRLNINLDARGRVESFTCG